MVMREFYIGPTTSTFHPKEEILGVMVQDVEVDMKISTTLPCSMLEKALMSMG